MNLRKAWRVAKSMRPHSVIFLGDMMDNGFADMKITECARTSLVPPFRPALSFSTTSRYLEYFKRFRSIFFSSPSLPIYYLTMLALGTVLTRRGLHDHATELHSAHFPNTWRSVGIP